MSPFVDAPIKYIPTPPLCIGRDDDVAAIAKLLCTKRNAQVAIHGGPGLGKGTIGLAILANSAVRDAFRNQIFYLRCDDLDAYSTFLRALALQADVESADAADDFAALILRALAKQPCLLFLDNVEVPLTCPDGHLVEAFLYDLRKVISASIVIAVRSATAPLTAQAWDIALLVKPVDPDTAEQIFIAYSGDRFRANGELRTLVAQLGGVPLALKLMALRSRFEDDILRVLELWNTKGTDAIARKSGDPREASIETALAVSLHHEWFGERERLAVAAIGFFPKGVARSLLEKTRFGELGVATVTLLELGLVERGGPNVYLLLPIRDYVRRHLPLPQETADSLAISCLQWMEERCKRVGTPTGSSAIRQVVYFVRNFETALLHALGSFNWKSACWSVSWYARAGKLALFGQPAICERAVERAEKALLEADSERDQLTVLKASMLQASAQQFEKDHQLELAGERYLQAIDAIADTKARFAETLRARLYKNLAAVDRARGKLDDAERRYLAAIEMFTIQGDPRRNAECSLALIDIDFIRKGNPAELIDRLDKVIADLEAIAKGNATNQGYRIHTERSEAKAFLLKGRVSREINSDLATNCFVKALFGFSASADIGSVMKVFEQLVELALISEAPTRLINYLSSKLGSSRTVSARARTRFLAYQLRRFARQTDAPAKERICLEIAERLHVSGKR